jgi:L-fucose isomerase-like protein
MAILSALTGKSGFMANPSCMDPDNSEIIFAHCTLPIDMPDRYELTTHFESGIGVAVTCDMIPQPMTIFKCDDTLQKFYVGQAELLETMHKSDLCRTQMRLHLADGTEYFLKNPISNHHIICKGDWKDVISEYFNQLNASKG